MMEKQINENIVPVLEEGDKLYHYTSAAGLQGIVGKEFWVTESHFLNDRSEFQIGIETYLEMIKEYISNDELKNRIIKELKAEMERMYQVPEIGDRVAYYGEYVISFCLEEDSILMWSEYSDFMGYSMEFDFQKLLDSFSNVYFHGTVIYNKQEQMRYMKKTFEKEFFNGKLGSNVLTWEDLLHLNDEQWKDFINHSSVICMLFNMFFKKECFAGEKEYRFIFSCIHDGGLLKEEEWERQYFRIKNGVYIPFVKQQISSLKSLESVMVGPRNESDIAVKGLEYFFRNEKLNVKVKKSAIPLRY